MDKIFDGKEVVGLSLLPSEIIFKILCYCGGRDILNISLTSSRFKYYINCNKLWDILLKRDYPYDSFKIKGYYYSPIIECKSTEIVIYSRYYISLRESAKCYYRFLKHFSLYKKSLYYKSIDRVLDCMTYIDGYLILDHEKIMEKCEEEIIVEIFFNSHMMRGEIDIRWDKGDMKLIKKYLPYLYEKIKQYNKYYEIVDILCNKILKILIGVDLEGCKGITNIKEYYCRSPLYNRYNPEPPESPGNTNDINKYYEAGGLLIKKGFSCKRKIATWLRGLGIPLPNFEILLLVH